jgi:hypothetical protein
MSLDLHLPREWIEARRRAERGELDDMTDANGDGCVDQRDLILHLSRRSAMREEEPVDALQGVPKGLRPVEVDTGPEAARLDDLAERAAASGRASDCDALAAMGRMN